MGNFFSKKTLPLILLVPVLSSCGDTLSDFYHELNQYGYIAYTTPLHIAGPGTIVGGPARSLAIIAHPNTCFSEDPQYGLRHRDASNLPVSEKTIHMNLEDDNRPQSLFLLSRFNFTPLKAFDAIKSIEASFKGIEVEYIDSVKLASYYEDHMPEICKEYLDQVGFIIQALRVSETRFTFYQEHNVKLRFDEKKISDFLALPSKIDWSIKDQSHLIITSPRYIGYQLGRLSKARGGVDLVRASSTLRGKFLFQDLRYFPRSKPQPLNPNNTDFVWNSRLVQPLDLTSHSNDAHSSSLLDLETDYL